METYLLSVLFFIWSIFSYTSSDGWPEFDFSDSKLEDCCVCVTKNQKKLWQTEWLAVVRQATVDLRWLLLPLQLLLLLFLICCYFTSSSFFPLKTSDCRYDVAGATEDIFVALDRWRAYGRVFWRFQGEGKKRGWKWRSRRRRRMNWNVRGGAPLVCQPSVCRESDTCSCSLSSLSFSVNLSIYLSIPPLWQWLGESLATQRSPFDSVSVCPSAFTSCRCFSKTVFLLLLLSPPPPDICCCGDSLLLLCLEILFQCVVANTDP